MTDRMLHSESVGEDCGCGPYSNLLACEVTTYSKCPTTFEPLMAKTTRRFSFDFQRVSCFACDNDNEFYEKIRVTELKKKILLIVLIWVAISGFQTRSLIAKQVYSPSALMQTTTESSRVSVF